VPSVLLEDSLAVRELYREEGFLLAEVEIPRVRLSVDGETARVELTIDEGPQFHIRSIDVARLPEFSVDELLSWTGQEVGAVFSGSDVLRGERRIRDALDERGYPDARVRGQLETEGTAVALSYTIEPRGLKRVGRILLQGNAITKDHIILRELALEPGDLISREKVLQSQHALYRLALFRNVRISYGPAGPDDTVEQIVVVVVEESPPYITSVTAGFDTEAGPQGSVSLSNENFMGRDRIVGVQARASNIERRLLVSATEPRFLGKEIVSLTTATWEDRDDEAFSARRASLSFRLDKQLTPKWTTFLRYSFQNVIIDEVRVQEELDAEKLEDVRLGSLGIALLRDTRDSPYAPTEGSYLGLNLAWFAKPLLSERNFVKPALVVTDVHRLPGGTAVASSLRMGWAIPYGSDSRAVVPISESYFLGGAYTLRGFTRDELGPGDSLFLLNAEFRFPIWKSFHGVVFYDAGNIYPEWDDLDPFDLRHVLGAGVRFVTPVGALRLEYGEKLDRREDETAGELYIAIGTAF
jgi:outer membrane protein insertion porin family